MRPCRSPTLRPQPNGISPALRRSRRSTSPRQVSRQTRTRTSSLRRPGPLPSASLGTRRRRGAAVGNSGAAALAGGTVGEYVEQIRRPRAALASASRTCPAPFPGVPSSLAKSGRSGQVRSDQSLSPSSRARVTGRRRDRWRQSSLPTESRHGHLALLLLEPPKMALEPCGLERPRRDKCPDRNLLCRPRRSLAAGPKAPRKGDDVDGTAPGAKNPPTTATCECG